MYNSFIARNFRCFHELKIGRLNRINLIAGKNNVGKSALLEALFFYGGAYNPRLALNLNAFRGIEAMKLDFGVWSETPLDVLFNQFDTSRNIELVGSYKKAPSRVLRLKLVKQPWEKDIIAPSISFENKGVLSSLDVAKVLELEYKQGNEYGSYYLIVDSNGKIRPQPIPPPPPFQTFFQGARMRVPFKEDAERFGNVEKHGHTPMILDVLKIMEPRLKRLAMVFEANEPILNGDIGMNRLIPLPFLGEGMTRLTTLALHIANAQNGVVLVDEIENGIHYSIMSKVWQAIAKLARKFDTQVFATTHSRECIVSAHKAFEEGKLYDFRFHRLEMVEEEIRAIAYSKRGLAAAIETGLEMR